MLLLKSIMLMKLSISMSIKKIKTKQKSILGAFETPTLLIWGEREIAYPLETFGRRFEADLPNSALRVLPEVGHYPQEERPDLLRRVLLERFEEIDG